MESRNDTSGAARLMGPLLPADSGLTSLGLLMQIGGALFLGFMTASAATTLLVGAFVGGAWKLFVVSGMCAVRSSYHYAAGRALVHGAPMGSVHGPLAPTRTYFWVAALQTILSVLALDSTIGDTSALIGLAAMWMAWPITLYILMRTARFQAMSDHIPRSEDHGMEGASVYMLLFGVIGTLFGGLMLYQLLHLPARAMSFETLAMFAIFGLLTARSVLQLVAGKNGLTGDVFEASADTRRYTWFAAVSTIIIGVILLLLMGQHRAVLSGFVFLLMIAYLLLAWPRILARFMDQRDVDAYIEGDANRLQRPPDMGLTALGWLLLALSVHEIAAAVPALLSTRGTIAWAGPGLVQAVPLSQVFGRPAWISMLVTGLQFWAALELIRMGRNYKLAAGIYGICASLLTLYLVWPFFQHDMLGRGLDSGPLGLGSATLVGQMGIFLTVPLGCVFLVRRESLSRAQARYRRSDDNS